MNGRVDLWGGEKNDLADVLESLDLIYEKAGSAYSAGAGGKTFHH